MPGVPDVYQGTETEALALVDPDNRRPVPYPQLRASLADGADLKQQLVTTVLRLRRKRPELFGPAGGYQPVTAPDELVAFLRGQRALTVAPRHALKAGRHGGGTATLQLPAGRWRDVLSEAVREGRPAVAELLGGPQGVALLLSAD